MNRPITITHPDSTVITNEYNKGGLLEKVKEGTSHYISNIDYNARGQRLEVYYGNDSKTAYTYDSENFRLERLLTTRDSGNDILMDLNYTYDSVGNIIQTTNDAEREFYFDNEVASPTATYTFDALYRLIEATGRELTSLQLPSNTNFVNNIPVPNTGTNAMQTYTQQFTYDELGNITQMKSVNDWTRDYIYDTATNQLLRHTGTTNVYTYDEHGNMLTMPHLTSMGWTYRDELMNAGNGTVSSYYNYDAQGNRTRKVVIKPGNIQEERYYIGGYEVYRKYISSSLDTERETIHISDDRDRFAMIDRLTVENGTTLSTPVETMRYQYSNHLGSASLELDSSANIISYEEYHPFGTTSYRAGSSEAEVSLKRYKYVGKERDEETGLYYYGARYYAAWIVRWVSPDPMKEERIWVTPYNYCQNNPVVRVDPTGALDDGWEISVLGGSPQKISSEGGDSSQHYYIKDENGNTILNFETPGNYSKINISTTSSDGTLSTQINISGTDGVNSANLNFTYTNTNCSANTNYMVNGEVMAAIKGGVSYPYSERQIHYPGQTYIGQYNPNGYNPEYLSKLRYKNELEYYKNEQQRVGSMLSPITYGGPGFGIGTNEGLKEGIKQVPSILFSELLIARLTKPFKILTPQDYSKTTRGVYNSSKYLNSGSYYFNTVRGNAYQIYKSDLVFKNSVRATWEVRLTVTSNISTTTWTTLSSYMSSFTTLLMVLPVLLAQ